MHEERAIATDIPLQHVSPNFLKSKNIKIGMIGAWFPLLLKFLARILLSNSILSVFRFWKSCTGGAEGSGP
jgi:hypothetical protein